MEPWRVKGPVDVARLNSGVFLAVLRKFALVVAICAPFYFGAILLLARLRAPQLSISFVVGHVWLYFVTAFVDHFAFGLAVLVFATAVTSLFCWRHVLARGGLNLRLALLASAAMRLVRRSIRTTDVNPVTVVARSARAARSRFQPTLLDQLRSSLSISSTAPPIPPVVHVVRIDSQLIARRIA